MTKNEKKSLYESIMQDISKTVKQKLNETFDKDAFDQEVNKSATGIISNAHTFKALASIAAGSNMELESNEKPLSLLIEVKDDDAKVAVKMIILAAFYKKNKEIVKGGVLNTGNIRSFIKKWLSKDVVIIDELEKADNSIIPVIMNMADGRIQETAFNPYVICITNDISKFSNPIKHRFNIIKMKY